jgi:hypothetical protein
MLSVELFLSDTPSSKQAMDEIACAIHGFFMDILPDIDHTKDIFVLFSGGYISPPQYHSREAYTQENISFQKRIFVRVGGKLISKELLRGEFEPSFPVGATRDAFEDFMRKLLIKREKRDMYFQYM